MQFYPKRTAQEQASRLPRELRQAYLQSQIDRITIFDGTNELEVTGYAEYSYLEEKSYKTQPVRTQDGAIQEIEEYGTFLTPRLIIKYNMMGIEDYRAFMKMVKNRNGFILKCYDVVEDKIVRNEMYVATPSMPVIYQQYLIAFGIQEYAIELIGTNVPTNPENIKDGTHIIHFSINGFDYEANIGQIWEEFFRKNPTVIQIFDGYVYDGQRDTRLILNGNFVKQDDYIFSEKNYTS